MKTHNLIVVTLTATLALSASACLDTSKGSSGDSGAAETDADADADADSDTDADADSDASAEVAGDYHGPITGPVIDVDYTITLVAIDPTTVRVDGADFESFEVPLIVEGSEIKQAGAWTDGSFSYTSGSLDLVYDPITLSFSGSKR